jgi:Bacterial regulatory proteins, gntR family
MRRVKLDRQDSLPLYEQVCAEIRRAIADGEIGSGERLPPARDLAAVTRDWSSSVADVESPSWDPPGAAPFWPGHASSCSSPGITATAVTNS